MSSLNLPTAEVFLPLLEPARYKGAWGGRGSGKSHFFADLSIEDALRFPGDYGEGMRMVCIREVQKDLKHSAKQLIQDKMLEHGVMSGNGFKLYNDRIETPGDGLILFQGMQDYNADSIKSLEGFHRAWTEEAQTLSDTSLGLLRPTIRWEDDRTGGESELWFSWNPRRKVDPVDVMLRQGVLPTGAKVVKANWMDNPWFPKVMETERKDCIAIEPEQYDHIWDGGYVNVLKGAYFAKHITDAKNQGRIGRVAADPHLPIRIYADIGGTGAKSDAFVMWAVQFVAREIRVLNHYESVGQEFKEHLQWLQDQNYTKEEAEIWLPHDGATKDKVFRVSYESAFRGAGYRTRVIPNQGTGAASNRIKEVRRLFPNMWFNKDTTESGVAALGWYHERYDDIRQVGLGPEHDWSSHSADAFGEMAISYQAPSPGGSVRPTVKRAMNRQRGR